MTVLNNTHRLYRGVKIRPYFCDGVSGGFRGLNRSYLTFTVTGTCRDRQKSPVKSSKTSGGELTGKYWLILELLIPLLFIYGTGCLLHLLLSHLE